MRFLALLTANIFLLTTLAWSAPTLPQSVINFDVYGILERDQLEALALSKDATELLNRVPVTVRGILEQLLVPNGEFSLGARLQTVFEVYAQVSQAA